MALSAKVNAAQAKTILLVTITVDPSKVEEFLKGFHICYDRCIEEAELLSFEVFYSQDEPGRFRFLEIWSKDREWFETVGVAQRHTVLAEAEPRSGANEQAIL